MDFETICESGPIRVMRLGPENPVPGGDLVIAFASIGHDPTRAPSPEFAATALGRGTAAPARRALFVSDESRSWANAPDFTPALRAALASEAARAPLGRVATIGQSMGAFCALVAARIVPVDAVLAFGPQWSVVPGAIPGEKRWTQWTGRIARIDWPEAPLPPEGGRTHATILHGATEDLAQARAFPQQGGTDHLIFPGQGHAGLVAHLKTRGALAGLLEAALAGDRRRLLRIAASSGGMLRHRFETAAR